MSLICNLIINTYSIVILIIIYLHSVKQNEKIFLQQRLYNVMLLITMAMLVLDTFSRFDGYPDTIYFQVNYWGNFIIFLLSPVAPSLWLLYAHCEVYHDESRTKRLIKPLSIMLGVHGVMTVLSLYFKWFYYIDNENIYHRGPLFLVPTFLTIGLILTSLILIVMKRKSIEKKHYFSLVFFAAPPFACIILQLAFYGISLILNGLTISILIVFITIQNRRMDTDYLTGVYNRKKLEAYMQYKINGCSERRTFSAVLIDLNNFKTINDTFGHDVGDQALILAACLIKSCIRSNDFIARYGGDEFYLILDVSDQEGLEQAIGRIYRCLEKYNDNPLNLYSLGFSIGYAVYDYNAHLTAEEFQKHVDMLMYENKRAFKHN